MAGLDVRGDLRQAIRRARLAGAAERGDQRHAREEAKEGNYQRKRGARALPGAGRLQVINLGPIVRMRQQLSPNNLIRS